MDIEQKIKYWAAPYSPFNPLDMDDIEADMKKYAISLNEDSIITLLDSMPDKLFETEEEEDEYYIYMSFMGYFFQYHQSERIVNLTFQRLNAKGPANIIDVIGEFRNPDLFTRLIKKIDYNLLDKEGRLALADSIEMLRNRNSLSYLDEIMKNEKDSEVFEQLENAHSRIEAYT